MLLLLHICFRCFEKDLKLYVQLYLSIEMALFCVIVYIQISDTLNSESSRFELSCLKVVNKTTILILNPYFFFCVLVFLTFGEMGLSVSCDCSIFW